MADRDTLDVLAEELAHSLQVTDATLGSSEALSDLLVDLGWSFSDPPTELQALRTPIAELTSLVTDGEVGDAQLPQLLSGLVAVFAAIADLQNSPGLAADFRAEFPRQLIDFIVVEYLLQQQPRWGYLLMALGLLRVEDVPAQGARLAYHRRVLAFDKLGDFLSDPLGFWRASYHWGQTDFAGERLAQTLAELFGAWGLKVRVEPLDAQTLTVLKAQAVSSEDAFNSALRVALIDAEMGLQSFAAGVGMFILPETTAGVKPGFALLPFASGSFEQEVEIGGNLTLRIKADIDLTGGVGILVRPEKDVDFVTGLGAGTPSAIGGDLLVEIRLGQPRTPITVIGRPDGSRLQFGGISTQLGTRIRSGSDPDVFGEFALQAGKIVIKPASGEADGFLAHLLPGGGFEVGFDLVVGFSTSRGFYLGGSAGFEITLPAHVQLGPVEITSGVLAVHFRDGSLPIDIGVAITATLGPVTAAVDGLGLTARFAFPSGGNGNLGPANLTLGFKPPTGIAVGIEVGPVTGGGFISFDPANGRYAGVLQLKLYEIGITAIGLLDTKLPGGKTGFSFLIIIAVEFTPIQLGFGFTLNGVGGLAGINRTLVTDELRQGVRQHSLENILFPQNPIARATQLISDLGRIFPPADGRYVFGPMVKLGWGTFVEAELGILIELPSPVRIAILGEVDAYFPLKDEAIIEIHLDVLGIIDFGAKLFSLDASLHDSRVLLFGLSGDMALRLSWGDDPSFAFSLGGLNPHFQPPPAFPTLRRLTLTLGDGDNPRLSLEGYFALTSNSFQFGAALSLYASLGELEVKGFLGFDALFIFSPFSFIIDFEADLDVTLGSLHLVGIHIHASLAGPTPWHISGELSVSLLFFDISVHVDFTLGDEHHDTLPAVDTWTPLQKAIVAQTSWEGVRPPLALQVVKLSAPEGSDAPVLVDPVGGATLREKILPLGQTITRFAEVDIAPVRYDPDSIVLGRTTITPPAVQDHFAPGAFRKMSDAEKISSPSFVWMQAGFTIASDAVALGGALTLDVSYTTRIIDAPDQRRDGQLYPMPPAALLAAARVAAAGTGLRATGTARFAPDLRADPLAAMNDEEFVVAGTENHKPQLTITPPTSKGLAQSALAQHLAANPEDRDRLQVMPAADVAA